MLVLGGLALSFIAPFSNITINPELVFLIFIPPLLYEAAWQVSWKEFWKWRGIIIGFAFPIVILTSCAIAFVSSAIVPGFTLALGFLLGGIISPPDAVSATTIMRQVNVPKWLVSIIEGESLLNDASALIVFRFALAAVLTGQFQFQAAAVNFVLVILIGISIGLVVRLVFYGIHRLLATTPSIEIVLTLVTPYCMYYFAEHYHFSGVLAVVSGGLFLSGKRNIMLSYQSRLEGLNVWTNLVFVFRQLEESNFAWQNSLKCYQSIYLEMLERRYLLNKMNHRAEFDEQLIRKYLALIDVEEFRVRQNGLQESDID